MSAPWAVPAPEAGFGVTSGCLFIPGSPLPDKVLRSACLCKCRALLRLPLGCVCQCALGRQLEARELGQRLHHFPGGGLEILRWLNEIADARIRFSEAASSSHNANGKNRYVVHSGYIGRTDRWIEQSSRSLVAGALDENHQGPSSSEALPGRLQC